MVTFYGQSTSQIYLLVIAFSDDSRGLESLNVNHKQMTNWKIYFRFSVAEIQGDASEGL